MKVERVVAGQPLVLLGERVAAHNADLAGPVAGERVRKRGWAWVQWGQQRREKGRKGWGVPSGASVWLRGHTHVLLLVVRAVVARFRPRPDAGEALVQVGGDAAVLNEVGHPAHEVAEGDVEVPNEVQRHAVEDKDDREEGQVQHQARHIGQNLHVEQVQRLRACQRSAAGRGGEEGTEADLVRPLAQPQLEEVEEEPQVEGGGFHQQGGELGAGAGG